jgi:PAS domain S-box-containing protein
MDYAERLLRSGVLRTRLLVSAAVLLLIGVTGAFERSVLLASLIAAYMLLSVLFWHFSSKVVAWRRIRAAPTLLDLLGVSAVVWATGGIESSWYLLYLFPILSIARYLGARRSLAVTAFGMLAYFVACYATAAEVPPLYPFALRVVIFVAVALTAGLPEKARERAEAKLLRAIDEIDHALTNTGEAQVTRSILDAAMEVTNSDCSAIQLADGSVDAAVRGEGGSEADASAAHLIVRQHYPSIMRSGEPLALPPTAGAAPLALRRGSGAEGWTARLIPLEIDKVRFGVLGVFSRRRLQYTHDDARRLTILAHQVAIAQKNATLYAKSQARLRLLYDVGERLKSEQSLILLFSNVVRLASEQLGSEEAALFIPSGGDSRNPQEGKGPLKKVAVAGPDEEIAERLRQEEELYEDQRSLTACVFFSKKPSRVNGVDPGEPHAAAYASLLPSERIEHYLAAPLLLGDEALGVIRVLNKKAKSYGREAGNFGLAADGFGEDDLELLSAIATQVASAIRNARFVEQHAYFRNMVDQSPDPIIVIDRSGWVQIFNQASEKLWGLTEEAVRCTHVSELYETPELAKTIGDEVWAAAERGEGIQDRAATIRKPTGEGYVVIPIRLAATGFIDRDGKLAGSIGIFTDEREVIARMEHTIRTEQLAALGRLAHAKGHDIKHDLATIRNWKDVLRAGADGDPDLLLVCSSIESAVSRGLAKLQDMLMAADPNPPNVEPASLRALLTSFEESIRHEARITNVGFHLHYPDEDHLVLADVDQMRQFLTNLFGNSLDAIKRARELQHDRPSGAIQLGVATERDRVVLCWTDDGCGMSEEVRAQAFTALFTTKKTGSGLGLFIVKTIVESHGGRIDLQPVHTGGVRLIIRLPFIRIIKTPQKMRSSAHTLDGGPAQ